jgi:hypothetical protein
MQPKQSCSLSRAGFTRVHHPESFGPLTGFVGVVVTQV